MHDRHETFSESIKIANIIELMKIFSSSPLPPAPRSTRGIGGFPPGQGVLCPMGLTAGDRNSPGTVTGGTLQTGFPGHHTPAGIANRG